ncbi:MAG: branched-chain amino acid ABC transporter permease [Actinomycetes bacterium]
MSQLIRAAHVGGQRRFVPLLVLVAMFAVVFSALFGAAPAKAADKPCVPHDVAAAFMVEGTLIDNDKPLANVKVVVTGEGFTGCGITDDTGYFILDAPKAGNYIASIDTTTLPAGVKISDADNQQPVDLVSTNDAPVLFPLGEGASTAVSFLDQLAGYAFQGLNFGLMLALCSLGLSLVFGTTGFSNFAHGETVSLGALLAWVFAVLLNWPIFLAAAVTIVIVAGYGIGQNKYIWRPLRKRRLGLNQTMIVSIGFAMAMRYLLLIFFDGDTKDLSGNTQQVNFGPIHTTNIAIISMVICVITLAAIAYFLTRTRIGKATRAVSDNTALASATGIDIESIIGIVWVVAAGTTAIAGILFGLQYQASWLTGANILLLMFAATTLGGLGTALGTTVGALVIGMVVQISAIWIPTDLTFATALVILILTLLVRPQGILGKKQRLG